MEFAKASMEQALTFIRDNLINVPVRIIIQSEDNTIDAQTKSTISRALKAGSSFELHGENMLDVFIEVDNIEEYLISDELLEIQIITKDHRVLVKRV